MDSAAENARVRLNIDGRVQGVYFRASTLQEAQNLGLVGWVRNRPGGSVEVLAEGARTKLEKLIAWCRHGPTGARVTNVDIRWETPEHGLHGFTIKN